jgi:hypothetical protein
VAFNYFRRNIVLPKLHILARSVSAIIMIAALLFLTSSNYWACGGLKKQNQLVAFSNNPIEEESDTGSLVPNPVEEKSSNGLQNLSEYLHEHKHYLEHPVSLHSFGNRHDIIHYPIHHPELITPPPKASI